MSEPLLFKHTFGKCKYIISYVFANILLNRVFRDPQSTGNLLNLRGIFKHAALQRAKTI